LEQIDSWTLRMSGKAKLPGVEESVIPSFSEEIVSSRFGHESSSLREEEEGNEEDKQ
jgi:hypothetical protein